MHFEIQPTRERRVDSALLGRLCFVLVVTLAASVAIAEDERAANTTYFPGKWDDWETRSPQQVGMDAAGLEKAIAFAKAHETSRPVDLDLAIRTSISGQAYDELIGPTRPRGSMNGLVLRHGYIVAEWGDTRRVDMTFSATKSYLATTAGLALDKGLIRKLDDPVKTYVPDELFASDHNSAITWHMLLNQTSEWEGTLWGKPDWAPVWDGKKMRELHTPGTHWLYNDVRVNCLALCLLHVWREPLPQVLKRHIMDPIDASPTWRWHGYRNSWIDLEGLRMQSVSGGGHWGGGLWINSRDHARFGYLFLQRGRWRDRQLVSEQWIDLMTTPTEVKPTYGYLWWLNTGKENPGVPASSFSAVGAGTNMVWIDPEHDLVVVVRWIDPAHDQEFVKLVVESVVSK